MLCFHFTKVNLSVMSSYLLASALILARVFASPFSVYPGQLGMYSWIQNYWTAGNPELLDFFAHPMGNQWIRGDVMFNVADWSCPDSISRGQELIVFMKNYRHVSGNLDNVFYLTYGDVTERNSEAMLVFVFTFFNWVKTISPVDAALIGKFGISFDVEKLNPKDTKRQALIFCAEPALFSA